MPFLKFCPKPKRALLISPPYLVVPVQKAYQRVFASMELLKTVLTFYPRESNNYPANSQCLPAKSTLDATFCKLHLKCRVNMEVPARFELANESFAGILTTVENPCDTNHFLIRLLQNDNHLLIILRSVIVGLTAVFPYPFFKFLL